MENRETTCCFSGHRPMKLPWGMRETDTRCIATKNWIALQLEELYTQGYRHFISGMAIGCDTYFAEEVLRLREKHPDVTLEAAIPCSDQAGRWNSKQKQKYAELIEACDSIKIFQGKGSCQRCGILSSVLGFRSGGQYCLRYQRGHR